jgi:hypothetical protein
MKRVFSELFFTALALVHLTLLVSVSALSFYHLVLLNKHKRDNVRLYDYLISLSLSLHLSIYTVLTTLSKRFRYPSPVVIPIITYSVFQTTTTWFSIMILCVSVGAIKMLAKITVCRMWTSQQDDLHGRICQRQGGTSHNNVFQSADERDLTTELPESETVVPDVTVV